MDHLAARRKGTIHLVQALAAAALLAGCARMVPAPTRAGEEAFDQIHTGRFDSADPASRTIVPLSGSARRARWLFAPRRAPGRALPPLGVLHPSLSAMFGVAPGSTPVDVFVTYADAETIPHFPRLRAGPRSDPANLAILDSARIMIDSLKAVHNARYAADTLSLKAHGAIIRRTFWLLRAVSITAPLDSLKSIAGLPEVVQIRPDAGEHAPSHDHERSNDMDAACENLGSDHYLGMGLTGGHLALLDTGVRTRHRLLNNPTPLGLIEDCMSGLSTDLTGGTWTSPGEPPGGGDTYAEGHGTSSATILVGNGNPIPATLTESKNWFHGVTSAQLDCFQVYGSDGTVNATATVQGFQDALGRLDDVIVAEMADISADMADVAAAADQAFEAGRAVVAPNGNYASYGTGYPARGRRVLGVGAYHLQLARHVAGQAYGSTDDGRLKPDLLAPSYTETADNLSDEGMDYFTGTSGAAPYAGGAALLLRNWLLVDGTDPDPGQVYSLMILAGESIGPFRWDSRDGVGLLHLPPAGTCTYGKTWVDDGTSTVDVPIEVPSGAGPQRIRAALWWPEPAVKSGDHPMDTHNDIDLSLVSPGLFGAVKAFSNGEDGVFERTEFTVPAVEGGRWILRIHAYTMRTQWQTVYWAASIGS